MKTTFLDFEQSVAELETKIEELRFVQDESSVDISDELKTLSEKSQQLTKELYENLSPWQVSQVARHPQLSATTTQARFRGEFFPNGSTGSSHNDPPWRAFAVVGFTS